MTLGRRLVAFLRLCSTVAAIAAAGALGPQPAWAGLFEVGGIKVDETAENAAAAREQAIAAGERKAFDELLDRLTRGNDRSRLPKMGNAEIAPFVQDFSIAEEKVSAVRYIATLDFRFKEERVRQFLSDHGVVFAGREAKPVVVLPVYTNAGALVLWDEPNPWRDAWEARQTVGGLVPTIVPAGDLGDIATIGAEQAAAGDLQRLRAIAARHGTTDTLVAVAEAGTNAQSGLPTLAVTVTRFGNQGEVSRFSRNFEAQPGEGIEALLAKAAAAIDTEIQEAWKGQHILEAGESTVIPVTVPVSGLREWLAVRGRLEAVAPVSQVDMVSLTRDEVRVNLHYVGDLSRLGAALREADLSLVQEGEGWLLRPAPKAAAGGS